MFVMHHTEPRPLSLTDRRALATVSRIASYVATTMDEKSFATRRAHLATLAEELRRQLSAGVDAISGFDGIGDRALTAVGADGLVFRLGGEVLVSVTCPNSTQSIGGYANSVRSGPISSR